MELIFVSNNSKLQINIARIGLADYLVSRYSNRFLNFTRKTPIFAPTPFFIFQIGIYLVTME